MKAPYGLVATCRKLTLYSTSNGRDFSYASVAIVLFVNNDGYLSVSANGFCILRVDYRLESRRLYNRLREKRGRVVV